KFFSIIAHDLKNPFSNLLNLSEILMYSIKEAKYDGLDRIAKLFYESSNQGYKLLENLLEWSRTQTGSIEYNPKRVDLCEIVARCIVLLKNLSDNKKISLDFNIKEETFVYCDEYMVTTTIRNLISNAIKFTKENGNINVYMEEQDDQITMIVSDTGIGIKKDNIKKLFQIDAGYSTKGTASETGTGLGLILCKEFVEKHGGKIWVESEEGKGSLFKFTLPRGGNTSSELLNK
ncbi:MAG: HAMP domain-containing histidine kinase, partial [Leptospiraceae bacterium]|nr:HAMP domain-containing histidine kinase [Leptospiraceae bacterium]